MNSKRLTLPQFLQLVGNWIEAKASKYHVYAYNGHNIVTTTPYPVLSEAGQTCEMNAGQVSARPWPITYATLMSCS